MSLSPVAQLPYDVACQHGLGSRITGPGTTSSPGHRCHPGGALDTIAARIFPAYFSFSERNS